MEVSIGDIEHSPSLSESARELRGQSYVVQFGVPVRVLGNVHEGAIFEFAFIVVRA